MGKKVTYRVRLAYTVRINPSPESIGRKPTEGQKTAIVECVQQLRPWLVNGCALDVANAEAARVKEEAGNMLKRDTIRKIRADADRQAALDEVMAHDPDAGERADAQEARLNEALGTVKGHTSGPWAVCPNEYHDGELTVVGGETGEAVIATVWPQGDDEAEQIANRQLIVAAPDLLAALFDILSDGRYCTDSYCEFCHRHAPKNTRGEITGPIEHEDGCIVEAGEAAIAKAEGRSL